ncbi:OB-fold domain-containing protein [Aquibium sp. LZ166]|uniref:OB-fold domain-containing protein n=1 Tax=Aquibium pacificus TaxID=3153579 RepID=A0ABV3SKK9_9HYPH
MNGSSAGTFVPEPSWLTLPFWEHANRGVLCRQKCASCGYDMFPPQFACRRCLGTDLPWVSSSGRGRIYSFTILDMGTDGRPLPQQKVLADVDLEEGWHMMTNVVGCPPDRVSFGMEVRVVWQRLSDRINLPVFVPE